MKSNICNYGKIDQVNRAGVKENATNEGSLKRNSKKTTHTPEVVISLERSLKIGTVNSWSYGASCAEKEESTSTNKNRKEEPRPRLRKMAVASMDGALSHRTNPSAEKEITVAATEQ